MLIVRKAPNKKNECDLVEEIKEQLSISNIKEDIGIRLLELMKQGGWSNRCLARISGLSDTTIRRIIEEKQDVTVETLHKICLALDVKLNEFMNDSVGWYQPED